MASGLAEILTDPNYVNANAATKAAIFEKYSAQDPNYTSANPATQQAIRQKFGLESVRLAESEGVPGPRGVAPAWAKEYPRLYEAAVTARQLAGPTVEMLGGALGGIGGAAAGTFGAGPVGTAVGGVTGAGLGYGTAKQALRNVDIALGLQAPETLTEEAKKALGGVVEGATYEVGGRLAAPVINRLVQAGATGVGKIADIRTLPNQLAARIARESFETPANLAAGRAALQAAPADVTAQQALAGGGVISPTTQAVAQRAISKVMPAAQETKFAAQEAARKSTIEGITPDLDAAIKARADAARPFYKAADTTVVPMDAEFNAVFSRIPKDVVRNAANIAKMEGREFIMGKGADAQITGESMHYIKRALSDVAYGQPAATGAGRDTQLAARKLLDDYVTMFENKVPDYKAARTTYSELSAPVNQAQVLKEMVSVLEKPGGGERIGPFLNVLGRGEQAMIKRAGGRGAPRFESLNEVLSPDQLAKVKEVAKQLETEAAVGQQINAGRQKASDLIKEDLPNYRLPNIFNVLATTANKMLDVIGAVAGKKTEEALAKAAMSAKSFDELLGTLPAEERSKVLKAISNPATWAAIKPATGKALMGVTAEKPVAPEVTNNLAPAPQRQNAFME